MILIRFSDIEAKRRALGFLTGRFSFTSFKTGEVLVPAAALAELAVQGIPFTAEGPAVYGQAVPPLRDTAATPV